MRYIGNKTRLLNKIDDFITNRNIKGEIFCDLFSGTSSVGDYFKDRYKIISNDFLRYSSVFSKAKLYNSKKPLFTEFNKKYNRCPFLYFNEKKYVYKEGFFVTKNYSPMGERQFLTENNAIKVDGIRLEIEELYKSGVFNKSEYYYMLGSLLESVTKYSNTTGTYEAFLKNWDSRSLRVFNLLPLELKNKNKFSDNNVVFNDDANNVIRKIEGDILYIDPPYTITEYSSAYHVLESIARYDYPEIKGKTGRRTSSSKSRFTRKKDALDSFEDLIKQAKFNDIIISYSTQSIISLEELVKMLSKYSFGEVAIEEIPYREYKNIRSSKKEKKLSEVLIHVKKNNKIIKSPLNYSGSKNDLIDQISREMPENITTFVDVMGGAFNVGINVVADKVIYNEYNPFTYNIIKYLLESQKKEIILNIEKKIKKFNLEKSNKMSYTKFRSHYNKTKKIEDLFILSMFCFQNQMRFNNSLDFNTPVGNCSYNETLKNRVLNFIPRTKNLEMMNKDFLDIDFKSFPKKSLFYFDPPYFITNATYNDGKRGFKGWSAELEAKLLEFITSISDFGHNFMLSNVIYHNKKINHILKDWIEEHQYNVTELKHSRRKEVLITNYKLTGGIR